MEVGLALIGFGRVGRAFARMLAAKRGDLERRYGLRWRIVGVSDIKYGSVVDERGIDVKWLLDAAEHGSFTGYPGGRTGLASVEVIEEAPADVVVEVTWTNVETGEPGLTHVRRALELGRHVITTNKGPIAVAYRELEALARRRGVLLRFEGTVLSGTPVISLAREALAGCEITEILGILNGTTNFMLTEMERGLSYEEALRRAQELGYAEADPSADVDGWDAAAKAVILANAVMGGDIRVPDVDRHGIRGIDRERVREALGRGRRLKLIARVWREGGMVRASVKPEEVEIKHPLAGVTGVMNAVTFRTDTIGEVTVIGPGAGPVEAAQALLSDLIAVHNHIQITSK